MLEPRLHTSSKVTAIHCPWRSCQGQGGLRALEGDLGLDWPRQEKPRSLQCLPVRDSLMESQATLSSRTFPGSVPMH
jgi:hypothetical protein